jgi:hypothetical protein
MCGYELFLKIMLTLLHNEKMPIWGKIKGFTACLTKHNQKISNCSLLVHKQDKIYCSASGHDFEKQISQLLGFIISF